MCYLNFIKFAGMKVSALIFLLTFSIHHSFAQNQVTDSIIPPEYPGGDIEILKYIQENLSYPQGERDLPEGTIYISLVVDTLGNASEVKVLKGFDPYLDKDVIKIISTLKGWKPAMQFGRPVPFQLKLPVRFVNKW